MLDLLKIKTDFNSMDEYQQWVWLLSTPLKDHFVLYLDNDSTSINFHVDQDSNYNLYFKSDIGCREGVEHLLKAIGVIAETV